MRNTLLDLFFPKRSLKGESGAWITEEERRKVRLEPVLLGKAELKRRGLTAIDAVVAAGSYDESPLLRRAILTYKFKRIPELGVDLAHWMVQAIPGLLVAPLELQTKQPVLCPVPLHWIRRYARGFDQAAVLATGIAKETGWSTTPLLARTRATGHQSKRLRPLRLTALHGAFAVTLKEPLPEFVILIDDLCTTGATLDECARSLKKSGVKYVAGLVTALG